MTTYTWMTTYTYAMKGSGAGGQTWETNGAVEVAPADFPDVVMLALKDTFMKLTQGNAVFGHPDVGCKGPYSIAELTFKEAAGGSAPTEPGETRMTDTRHYAVVDDRQSPRKPSPYDIDAGKCAKCGGGEFHVQVLAWATFENGTFVAFEYGEEVIPMRTIAVCAECSTERAIGAEPMGGEG